MLSVMLQVSHNDRSKTKNNNNNKQKMGVCLQKLSFFSSSESMKKTSEILVFVLNYTSFRYAIVLISCNSRGKLRYEKNSYSKFCLT